MQKNLIGIEKARKVQSTRKMVRIFNIRGGRALSPLLPNAMIAPGSLPRLLLRLLGFGGSCEPLAKGRAALRAALMLLASLPRLPIALIVLLLRIEDQLDRPTPRTPLQYCTSATTYKTDYLNLDQSDEMLRAVHALMRWLISIELSIRCR